MSTYKWRPQEEHLLKLLLPTNSHREISEQINRRHEADIPGFPCPRSVEAVRKKCDRDSLTADNCNEYTTENNPIRNRMNFIKEIQEEYEELAEERMVGILEEYTTKILCMSDIHFPFARVDLLKEIIELHADADIVVINGDLLESYIFSTFKKDRRIAAVDEYRAAFAFIEELSNKFPKVVLTEGNHDVRSSRLLSSAGVEIEASQLLRPNLIARIANGEELDSTGALTAKKNFSNVYYEPRESWYVKIGKTIFLHPHGMGSKKPGYTVEKWANYFNQRYAPGEVDSFVCGHTHKIYKGIINGQLLIEQGYLAGSFSYMHKPNNYNFQNYMNGYAVIYQDEEGNTDFNCSGPVYLGFAMPPKKDNITGE